MIIVSGVEIQQTVFDAWLLSDNTVAGVDVVAPASDSDKLVYSFVIETDTNTTYLDSIVYSK